MHLVEIAKICHEVNRAYCQAIGDNSQPAWEDAPKWQKESAINGVTYHLDNPDSTPAGSHINWMRQKFNEGWVYGEVKDPDKRTHPCLVPYEQLPLEQRIKDHLFISVVRSIP